MYVLVSKTVKNTAVVFFTAWSEKKTCNSTLENGVTWILPNSDTCFLHFTSLDFNLSLKKFFIPQQRAFSSASVLHHKRQNITAQESSPACASSKIKNENTEMEHGQR